MDLRGAAGATAAAKKLEQELAASITAQVPRRVQSRINLPTGDSKSGWLHVLLGHFDSSKTNKSLFTVSENELRNILQSSTVVSAPITSVTTCLKDQTCYVRVIDLGHSVGIDKFTNQSTSTLSVMTDKFGNLVTATPGVLK